jgi:hypothetical protein
MHPASCPQPRNCRAHLGQAIAAAWSPARLQPHAHAGALVRAGSGERDAADLALLADHFKIIYPEMDRWPAEIIDPDESRIALPGKNYKHWRSLQDCHACHKAPASERYRWMAPFFIKNHCT